MYKKFFLKKCSLFSDLDERELTKIEAISILKRIKKDTSIFREGESAGGFFIVNSGRVKIYKISKTGKEQVLFIAGPSDVFAEAAIFSGGMYPAYADTLTNCELLYIPKIEFIELLKGSPSLSLKMLGSLSKIIRYFNALIEDLSLKEVPARLAKYLLDISLKANSNSFVLDAKKSDIALKLGTVSETLSRALKKLREKRIISIKKKHITILKKELLQKIVAGFKI